MRDFLRAEALLAEPDDQVRLDGTTLRVRATREEHRRIAEHLGLLTATSEPIRIEAVLAPAEVLNAAFPAWRAARADGLPVETFEKALADPRSRFFSLDARSGELVASGGRTIELFRSGDEVNQTGIVPVSDPLLCAPMAGARLEVLPVLLPGGGRVWLDLRVGSFCPGAESRVAGDEWGQWDFPRVEETLIATRLIAPSEKAIFAALVEERAPSALIVRVTAPGGRRAAAPATDARRNRADSSDGRIAIHHLGPILDQKVSFPWPSRESEGDEGDIADLAESEKIEARLVARLGEAFTDGSDSSRLVRSTFSGLLVVAGPPDAHSVVEGFLRSEAEERSRTVAIEIVVVETDAAQLGTIRALTESGLETRGVLRPGWETDVDALKDARLHRFAVRGCHRVVHAVRQAKVRTFLTDLSFVSGGTGFAVVERIQPEVASCADGAEMRVRADLANDPAQPEACARLQVEGAIAAILDERSVKVPYRLLESAGSPSAEGSPAAGTGRSEPRSGEARLTLPRQKVARWNLERRVPLGRHVILQTESGEDGAVVLIGRVTAE
ncbi:MAG: hypothetical protein ACUVYA_13565 [Planctomycetota bacterium]